MKYLPDVIIECTISIRENRKRCREYEHSSASFLYNETLKPDPKVSP